MDLRERLSDRIHIEDIHEILRYVQGSQKRKSELYGLIFDPDETIGYQALWACSHFSADENKWLYDKQDELINEILVCKHPGKTTSSIEFAFTTASSESPTGGFPELLPRPDAFSEGITRCANALHETGI
mgnify:CR=1 FL=1